MGEQIDDTLLHEIALVGSPEDMPRLCRERYAGRLDRVSSYYPWPGDDPDRLREILAGFAEETEEDR